MDDLLRALSDAGIAVEEDVSARKLSTFAAGGMVHHLVLPTDAASLHTAIRLMQGVRYHVLGGGSNTLISDFGLEWVLCTRRMRGTSVDGLVVRAGAGEMLPALARTAADHGLGGLEFACGIPGTVGGALRMNAGAFGQAMSDTVMSATVVDSEGAHVVCKDELHLRYRDSTIRGIVADVTFACAPKETRQVEATMRDMQAARAQRQPHQPSLGCVFKAAGGTPAAKLIQGCGLKGTRIGQAQLSGIHCNFIINAGGATARDYLRLVDVVKVAVHERYGVYLEEEFVHMHD